MSAPRFVLDHYTANGAPVYVPADPEERQRVIGILREPLARAAKVWAAYMKSADLIAYAAGGRAAIAAAWPEQAAEVAREAAELFAMVEVEPAERQVGAMLSQVTS